MLTGCFPGMWSLWAAQHPSTILTQPLKSLHVHPFQDLGAAGAGQEPLSSGNPLLSAQSLLSPRAGQPAPVLPPVFQGSVSAPVLPSHLAPGSSWMSHPDVLGNPPFFLNTLPQVTHSSWWRGSWNFLPSTPAPAAPSQTAPAVPLQPAPAVPSQPAPPVPSLPSTYSPALTACTCCGEPGWRRTQCRHSSTPSTSMDASTAVTESGGVRLSLSQDQVIHMIGCCLLGTVLNSSKGFSRQIHVRKYEVMDSYVRRMATATP